MLLLLLRSGGGGGDAKVNPLQRPLSATPEPRSRSIVLEANPAARLAIEKVLVLHHFLHDVTEQVAHVGVGPRGGLVECYPELFGEALAFARGDEAAFFQVALVAYQNHGRMRGSVVSRIRKPSVRYAVE
eukprot:GEZU01019226.1.p1 GENE.GEZU01019226.1~~GEZU01019226.1.p1  ORF type:complete len:130 (-),score=15.25 GEZU01019226.1:78-467(-)